MPSFILEDDCLVPDRQLRIDYKGPNPFKLYAQMSDFLKAILDVRGKDIWQREFRWDFNSEPRTFFVRFIVKKKYDLWSNVYVETIMQGKQPSDPTKDGEVTILLRGKLLTKSPEDTIWSRSTLYKTLRWIYFRTLYNDVRRNYLEECGIKINDLARAIQNALGISPEQMLKG